MAKKEQVEKLSVRILKLWSGPGKLRSNWEPKMPEVVSQYENDASYKVKSNLLLINKLCTNHFPMKNKI